MTELNTAHSRLDAVLEEGLAAVERWETSPPASREEHEAAEAATRCFAEIDRALRDGERAPTPWRLPAMKRLLEHVQAEGAKFTCGDPDCTDPGHVIQS